MSVLFTVLAFFQVILLLFLILVLFLGHVYYNTMMLIANKSINREKLPQNTKTTHKQTKQKLDASGIMSVHN